MDKIIFATTFNKHLYDIDGKNMVRSFLDNVIGCKLFISYEDLKEDELIHDPRLIWYNMEEDAYMLKWLESNKDIIPNLYGGECKDDSNIFKVKKPWGRFRASRFFRKIVNLKEVINRYYFCDYIVVLDCDIIFKQIIYNPWELMDKIMNEHDFGYFWGQYRKDRGFGPETGFTCYNKRGQLFAKCIIDCFSSGKFRAYHYWDDGFITGRLILENLGEFKFLDFVDQTKKETTRVMEILGNPLIDYIHHNKSEHKESC